MTKRLTTLLATIVLGTTLLGPGANAAVLATGTQTISVVPADVAQTVTVDGSRPVKDGDHHRRFCAKLNTMLTRLVDNNVITREQKLRIMDAFNCVPDTSTDKPSTTRPTTVPPAAE
jgi:hypothetical protein